MACASKDRRGQTISVISRTRITDMYYQADKPIDIFEEISRQLYFNLHRTLATLVEFNINSDARIPALPSLQAAVLPAAIKTPVKCTCQLHSRLRLQGRLWDTLESGINHVVLDRRKHDLLLPLYLIMGEATVRIRLDTHRSYIRR